MLTSKQRSNLRSMAQKIEPITQVGKGGISENLLQSLADALDARELIKVTVLENCDNSALETIEEIAAQLDAEPVCVTGRKGVIYKKSRRKDFKHLEF